MKTYFSILAMALTSLAIKTSSAQTYVYDDVGRLAKVLYPNGKGVAYIYDINDNLSQLSPIEVPPAASRLSIVAVPVSMAELSWEHSGNGSGFLIQRRVTGTEDWIDVATVGINERSTTVSNVARQDLFLRIVVVGSSPEIQSTPSAPVHFPSGTPLLVTTLADENDHSLGLGTGDSLREVIEAAFPGDLINFAPVLSGRTIVLKGTELGIRENITIDASPLPDRITIHAGGASRVFGISGAGNVILRGLTIAGGDSSLGGGISNDGVDLTLRRCMLTGNHSADNGGAVYNFNGGILAVNDGTVFSSNTAAGGGGAIYNALGCSLDVNGATFTDNSAVEGGAIHNLGAPFMVGYASFSGNGANTGGGIFNMDSGGLVLNSTLAANGSTDNAGGGVANRGSASLILRQRRGRRCQPRSRCPHPGQHHRGEQLRH